jgi:hypothetical protein
MGGACEKQLFTINKKPKRNKNRYFLLLTGVGGKINGAVSIYTM